MKYKYPLKEKLTLLFILFFSFFTVAQNNKIELKATVVDEFKDPVPYAAVGFPAKYIGTSTTEEGTFFLQVSANQMLDTLQVSSIGFKTFKITVKDFIDQKIDTIVLEEDVTSLEEVTILLPKDYVKLSIKKLSKNTISKTHQLNILYRRFSVEDYKSRFLVEHYINVLDPGIVKGEFKGVEVVAARKSADYRFIKKKLPGHPVNVTAKMNNPLRTGFNQKRFNWKIVGDTSYDGEEIIIIEGQSTKNKRYTLKLYIGMTTYGIYRIENSRLNALYIYKKDANGKLHLSYHNRTRNSKVKLTKHQKKLLNTTKEFVQESYKHEMYVLGLETRWIKYMNSDYKDFRIDIGDIEVNYDAVFWKSLSLPPETAFYKKNKQELESHFGVSLEKQFELTN